MSSKFGGEVSFRYDFPIFPCLWPCADHRSLAVPGLRVGRKPVVHGSGRGGCCPVLAAHRRYRPGLPAGHQTFLTWQLGMGHQRRFVSLPLVFFFLLSIQHQVQEKRTSPARLQTTPRTTQLGPASASTSTSDSSPRLPGLNVDIRLSTPPESQSLRIPRPQLARPYLVGKQSNIA